MIRWFATKRCAPIGVDLGRRSVKLVQFNADHSRLIDAARWELPLLDDEETANGKLRQQWCEAVRHARSGRRFRGREAVVCLGQQQLFLQNIRVPKTDREQTSVLVQQEIASRLPFSVAEAEIRFIEAADVRQGENIVREVIVMACHRPALEDYVQLVESLGLLPVAVEVEPIALARCYTRQFRRDNDRDQRTIYVHIGYSRTAVLIAQGQQILFFKYLDECGRQLDEAVAKHLNMKLHEATALRKHNGDRRADQQDPVVARNIAEATRPVVDRLCGELAKCIRYHSVTFRGQPIVRLLLGGGEATPQLLEALAQRVNMKCELSDPLRGYMTAIEIGRKGVWDIAAGLALRN